MRKAEEGLGASNGAEGYPSNISLAVDALLASSSAPRDQDSASVLPSASDELSAIGTVSPAQPITTTDISRPAAPTTSLLPSITRSNEALISIDIPSDEPRERNDDDQGPFKLAKTFLGLTFPAALALMIYLVQPQQDDSSTNLSPQGDSSANLSSLSLQGDSFALPSASDELSAVGTVSPAQPITTTDVSRPAAPAAPSTSLLPSITRSNEALISIDISSDEPRDRNDDDQGPFKLAKTFMGLTFQAALALMIYRVQPQQDDSSTNLSPQGDSSANLSSLSAIQFDAVGATTLFSFASTMSGMMLKNHNRKAANFCSYAGVFWGALGFFLMLSIFADESLDWLVWAVGGIMLLVFAYTIRREMGI